MSDLETAVITLAGLFYNEFGIKQLHIAAYAEI